MAKKTLRDTILGEASTLAERLKGPHPAYAWAVDRIENSTDDVHKVRADFKQKFGGKHTKHLEKAIDDVAGY